jgi:hypothetical protein
MSGSQLYPIPEFVSVWWHTSRPDNMAKVLRVDPYRGRYPQYFTHVLTLEAPNTRKGELEMTWNARQKGGQ